MTGPRDDARRPHDHRSHDHDAPPHEGHGPDDEHLPERDDPYWSELTTDTLRYVRRLRADERRRKLGSAAYTAYVVLVVVVMYVVPYVWYAIVQDHGPGRAQTSSGWALGAVGVTMLALVAFVRDGAWRGPAVLDRATVAWLLPAPLHREALLRPRWRTSLAVVAGAGAALGGLGAVAVRVVTGGPVLPLVGAGVLAGLLVGAGGTAQGALAETGRGPSRGIALWWLVPFLVLGGAAWVAFRTGTPRHQDYLPPVEPAAGRTAAAVLLWSGPWGWAVQPFLAALPGSAPGGVDRLWPVGAVLAVLVVGVACVLADRLVVTVDARSLRTRADSVALVGASILALQPRRARLSVVAAQGHAPSTRLRLPAPRRRALLAPWRDLTALLRHPSRLLWAAVWLVVAVVVLSYGLNGGGLGARVFEPGSEQVLRKAVLGERLLLGVPGFIALYLAAAQLVEPARLDADDVRRMRIRPTAATRQALAHAVVPVAMLGVVLVAATVVVSLLPAADGFGWFVYAPLDGSAQTAANLASGGAPSMTTVALLAGLREALAAMPALVGASLVSAYRGEMPLSLLTSGAAGPMGDPGPFALLSWYVRAPMIAIACLVPRILGWGVADVLTAAVTVGMLVWAGNRAEAMLRA